MRSRFMPLVAVVLVLLAAAALWPPDQVSFAQTQTAAAGQPYDAKLFGGLKWRSIGPNRGGRSIAVAGSPARPLEYYFGATGGGIWKTTDGGTTWRPAADAALKTSSVGAIAVSESNPDVVYAGMGEVQLRGNVIQGDGVYKTADGGRTWQHAGLADSQNIGRIRIHPGNPDIVYAAALGHTYGPNEERGVFRSRDGGKTWQRVLFRDAKTGAVDLVFDPKNPDVLYAALWEVFRTPHSLSSGGPGSGLFKTSDGGETWTELTRNPGLPKGVVGKIGVSVSGADSQRVWAIIEAEDGGIFLSDDGGATWKKVSDERRFRQRAFYYTRIYADPKARDRFYVLNVNFFRSDDAGKTFQTIRVPHGDNHDLWIAPNDTERLVQGNDGGANVSVNGGETWTDQDYPTAQMYHVVTTSHVPYHVCGAQQDNSTACVPSTGTGGEFYAVGGGESGYIAPDPRNPNVFYAGSYGGLLTRYDRVTGQARQINVWPENPMGHSSKDIRERFQWTFPIVFDPANPQVLYVGSQHVWRTTTEGQSWERISPDLTRADPSTMGPSGGPITLDQTGVETYATIFTIAPSKRDPSVIWTGSDDGVVSITRDGGKSWEKVTPPDLPDFARISLIDASPHAAGTAYLAANRYQRDDRAPYFYRTADYGRTWTRIVSGIRPDEFARAIREDPRKAGLLFAGTEQGIYVSFDNGTRWQPLSLNLPVTPVHDIALKDGDLVIATHGRSFYVLDNISVLRQLTPAVTTEALFLFEPAETTRSVSRGVTVDYYLANKANEVTIEILGRQGETLRRFSSAAAPAERPAGEGETRGSAEPRVPAAAGMNRFVWDTRLPSATEFPNLILWAASTRGPRVAPGAYQVRVTADGVSRTAPFVIRKNPLLTDVTEADLAAQFELARQIQGRVDEANKTVMRIRDLKTQVEDRLGRARDAKLRAAGQALTSKLTEVEGEIYQYRNQSSQDPLNYPIKLNNKLAALQGVVDGGDGRPTQQSYTVFKELSSRLETEIGRLTALVTKDLAALNTLLKRARLEPIVEGGTASAR